MNNQSKRGTKDYKDTKSLAASYYRTNDDCVAEPQVGFYSLCWKDGYSPAIVASHGRGP